MNALSNIWSKQEPSPEAFLFHAREIWKRNPYKQRAFSTEDREFREHFGCSIDVCLSLWNSMEETGYLPPNGRLEHLLWGLMFLKIYGTERVMCSMAGGPDKDTFRKWSWLFVDAIASLEYSVVSS